MPSLRYLLHYNEQTDSHKEDWLTNLPAEGIPRYMQLGAVLSLFPEA